MSKKLELQALIDEENGLGFHKNIDLSGYTFYKGSSFISFKFYDYNGINICKVCYIYITSQKDFIKLLSFAVDFWAGNNVKFIYFLEHVREANYCKKFLKTIGFTLNEIEDKKIFKHIYVPKIKKDMYRAIEYYI